VDAGTAGTTETAPGERPLPRRPVRAGEPAARPVPPRPPLTTSLAPPLTPAVPPRPRAVRLSGLLCWAAVLATGVGLLALLLDRAALDARLAATATAGDPGASATQVSDAVAATIAMMVGAVGLVAAVMAAGTALALRRRSWARWLLAALLLPTLLVLDVAQSTAAGDADLDRVALVVAAALFLLVPVPLLTRSARAWFRPR
jgi:hypothetical protein